MKIILTCIVSLFLFHTSAQVSNFEKISANVVNSSLSVKKGEVVLINGSPGDQDIMESLYYHVAKAGGIPILDMYFPDADVRCAEELPIEYLEQPIWPNVIRSRMADCLILVESVDDPDRWKNVKPEAIKAFQKGSDQVRMINEHRELRVVTIGQSGGRPTKELANMHGAEFEKMESNFWKAISTDYGDLKDRARTVVSGLSPGMEIQINDPAGTNIRMTLAAHDAMISCGKTNDQKNEMTTTFAWLPAGDVFTSLDVNSANGKIVVPEYFSRGEKFTNLTLEFEKGQITSISADQNVDWLKNLFLSKGKTAVPLSSINIGVNPFSKPLGSYRSFEMAGVVTLIIGENDWSGGEISNGIDYAFHLKDATLSNSKGSIVKAGILQ